MKKRIVDLLLTFTMVALILLAMSSCNVASVDIGDYVQMGTYYGEPILWRCVDIDDNGPLMLSDKIICMKPYDASGENTDGSHIRSSFRQGWGSNCWSDSNMRSWLNSAASAGNVEWLCGNPPDEEHAYCNSYSDEAGFLTNFSNEEINAIKEVMQKSLLSEYDREQDTTGATIFHYKNKGIKNVIQNYDTAYAENVTDKIFLLDVKQINSVYNNSSVLGEGYYIGEPTAMCVEKSEYSKKSEYSPNPSSELKVGKKWVYWLRSPLAVDDNSIRCVSSDGSIESNNSNGGLYGVGVRPAFYLNTKVIFKAGSGTESDPYIITNDKT